MVSEKMEPVALVVDKLKGFAKSTQDFTNGVLHSFGFSSRRNPIEILKRLQREAFSDIMKLRERQDKMERLLSFKSSKLSPFDEVCTRVRGEVAVLGLLLMIDRINEDNQDAIFRTGIRSGINSRVTFETIIRDRDTLTAEFLASDKDNPLSLAKVLYKANINEWLSLIAVPLGARCSDVGPFGNSRQDHGLTSHSFNGPPILNKQIGGGIGLTVKKSNIIASLAQFISVLAAQPDSPGPTHSLTTLGQITYQLSTTTKLSLLGLNRAPKFSTQPVSLGPMALPVGMFRHRAAPMEALDSSLGSTALVLESELDSSTRIGGWVEMSELNSRRVEWGVSICDVPEDEVGWGVRVGGLVQGSKSWEHCEAEAFSRIKVGEKFWVQPTVVYVMDSSTRFPAIVLKSSWCF